MDFGRGELQQTWVQCRKSSHGVITLLPGSPKVVQCSHMTMMTEISNTWIIKTVISKFYMGLKSWTTWIRFST